MLPQRVPIPPPFRDAETGAPFEECLACERPLRAEGVDYIVEKGIRTFEAYDVQETVFGYALCLPCHASLSASFSEASRQRCQAFLEENVDLRARTDALLDEVDDDPADPAPWTEHCIVHGTSRADLQEYQLLAHCRGDALLLTHLPLMIGGPAVEALVERLSAETRDELGGFRDTYFGVPPELQQNPQGPVLA